MNQDQTVIVIGAGIAGLTAAQKLGEKGYKIILLEARQDVGGRVRVSHDIPLGPLYLHEIGEYQGKDGIQGFIQAHPDYLLTTSDLPASQPIPALLQELNVRTAIEIRSTQVWHNNFEQSIMIIGENAAHFDRAKFNAIFLNYRNQRENYFPSFSTADPVSIEEQFAKALATTFAEAYSGIAMEEFENVMQNAKKNELVFFEYGDMHHIVEKNGYYTFVKHIESSLKNTKLYFDSFVTKIEQNKNKVVVKTLKGEQYLGDAIVVTLPLGVLQKNVVQISDLSNNKKLAIQNLKMGIMNTVTLKFKTQFWKPENMSFVVLNTRLQERPVTVFFNANKILENIEPTLIASFFANDGLRDSQVLIEEAKNAIKQAWPDAPDPIFEEATAWHQDPYTYGSYASFSLDTKNKDIVNMMSPEWDGRLVLAGDAVVPIGLMGCFHGAYISALRAARLIDESLRSCIS